MRDILPNGLVDILRDRYLAGVADAEALFDAGVADEDSLTGALGQAIAKPIPYEFFDGGDAYSVKIMWKKIRGRGPNAPERLYGADGLFQILVSDANGSVIRSKGLPFQSKTNWHGRSAEVARQSRDIESSLGGGIVLNFKETGYEACTTAAAVESSGNRRQLERAQLMKPLGQMLGNDFLNCTIGQIGLYFDPEDERFYQHRRILSPANTITTFVRRRRAA